MAGLNFFSLLGNNLRRYPFRHGIVAACVAAAVSLQAAVGLLSGGAGSRIELSLERQGALGAMINGAGGGGSITLLCLPGRRAAVAHALREESFTILPCTIAREPALAWRSG